MNAIIFPLASAASRSRRFAHLLNPTPRLVLTRLMTLAFAAFASLALAAAALIVVTPAWSQGNSSKNQPIYKAGADGVTQPKVLSKVDPDYTQEAKDAHIEGPVVVKMVVTADGVADDMQVVRGIDPGLDQKALEALAKWKFQPATKDGQAVSVYATVEVNFRLK